MRLQTERFDARRGWVPAEPLDPRDYRVPFLRTRRVAIVLALAIALAALCGCTGGTIYENDNGPRGPERLSVPSAEWPDLRPCRR